MDGKRAVDCSDGRQAGSSGIVGGDGDLMYHQMPSVEVAVPLLSA